MILKLFTANSERGGKIWKKLNSQLPQATGCKENDTERLQQFAIEVGKMNKKQKADLQCWLDAQVHEIQCNYEENTSFLVEEIERTWLQIYSEHLRVLKSKTP